MLKLPKVKKKKKKKNPQKKKEGNPCHTPKKEIAGHNGHGKTVKFGYEVHGRKRWEGQPRTGEHKIAWDGLGRKSVARDKRGENKPDNEENYNTKPHEKRKKKTGAGGGGNTNNAQHDAKQRGNGEKVLCNGEKQGGRVSQKGWLFGERKEVGNQKKVGPYAGVPKKTVGQKQGAIGKNWRGCV